MLGAKQRVGQQQAVPLQTNTPCVQRTVFFYSSNGCHKLGRRIKQVNPEPNICLFNIIFYTQPIRMFAFLSSPQVNAPCTRLKRHHRRHRIGFEKVTFVSNTEILNRSITIALCVFFGMQDRFYCIILDVESNLQVECLEQECV